MTAPHVRRAPIGPQPNAVIGALAVSTLAAIFALDVARPIEYLDAALYVIPIVAAWVWRGRRAALVATVSASVLTLVALWLNPPRGEALGVAFYNRLLVLGLLVAAGVIGWWFELRCLAEQVAQDRFESIAHATNDAIWDYDILENRLWWSEGHRQLFGTDPVPRIEGWYDALHPDDRDRVITRFRGAIDGPTMEWQDEFRYRRADGSYAEIVHHGVFTRDSSGRALRMIGGMRDITEQKLARIELRQINQQLRTLASQYRALLEQSLAGILVMQGQRLRYANPKLAEMTGWTVAELLAMPNAFESVVEEDRQRAAEAMQKRMSGDVSGIPTRLRWKRPDGAIVWAEVHGSRIEYEGAPALMGVTVDITARQEAEGQQQRLFDQLLSARERLQALSRQLLDVQEEERRQLARDLHDEIGQALTVLKMNTQTLQVLPHIQDAPTLSGPIEDSLKVINSLIQHVRNLSLDLRPAMLDDLGLPETLRWFVARQAGRAGWTAAVNVDDELTKLPAPISLACFRIVQECLSNTMRHAKATQVTLEAGSDRGALHMAIHDNGIGFDVARAMERGSKGQSVGLLSMQERVRALHGECLLESSPHTGTSLTVTIPLGAST